jgi:hypothetical protein
MVTSNAVKAAGVTSAAICGMLLGFYVQDVVKQRRIERIDRRVEEEVERRRAQMQSNPATPQVTLPTAALPATLR